MLPGSNDISASVPSALRIITVTGSSLSNLNEAPGMMSWGEPSGMMTAIRLAASLDMVMVPIVLHALQSGPYTPHTVATEYRT